MRVLPGRGRGLGLVVIRFCSGQDLARPLVRQMQQVLAIHRVILVGQDLSVQRFEYGEAGVPSASTKYP